MAHPTVGQRRSTTAGDSRVETRSPNGSDTAMHWKTGSLRSTAEPPIRARAVIRMGSGCGPGRVSAAAWRRMAVLIWLALPAVLLLAAPMLARAASDDAAAVTDALRQTQAIDRELGNSRMPATDLVSLDTRLQALHQSAKDCIDGQSGAADKLDKNLALLGKPTAAEDAAVAEARREMERKRGRVDRTLASCRLLLVRSDALAERLQSHLEKAQAQRLLARGPGLATLSQSLRELPAAADALWTRWPNPRLGLAAPGAAGYGLLALLTVAALVVGLRLRRRLRVGAAASPASSFASSLVQALAAAAAHYAVVLLPVLVWAGFWSVCAWMGVSTASIAISGVALAAWLLFALASRGLLAPPPPIVPPLPCDQQASRRLDRALRVAAALVSAGIAIRFLTPGRVLPPGLGDLAQTLYLVLLGVVTMFVSWRFLDLGPWPGRRLLRLLLSGVIAVAVGAELSGYRGLGPYLLQALLLSVLIITGAWLLARLVGDFFDGLDDGRHGWQRALQGRLGAEEDQNRLPGSLWLRLLAALCVWTGAGLLLLPVWAVPDSVRSLLTGWLTAGVDIDGLRLSPLRVAAALAVLGLLLSAVAVLKRRVETRWLRRAYLEEGTRNAFATLLGYAGAALAGLTALAVAGVDLSKLALIAGALSVGIGFGLQNVVNNFVSGLILLFERPIRRGDWIVVGETEGRVHHVSIRSTKIRTFDRADVVVPNSELISGQVTNWTLRDPVGRVRVPVGVAYGSDLGRVREILLGIAAAQPLVLADARVPEPTVLFLGFGDSALSLELRFFVSDINQRLTVLSEVNFAIDAAFREAAVEIPFPQRDLHLRSGPASADRDRSSHPEQDDHRDAAADGGVQRPRHEGSRQRAHGDG
jgi:potassium efflux system protein